jgi:hypothetical protein
MQGRWLGISLMAPWLPILQRLQTPPLAPLVPESLGLVSRLCKFLIIYAITHSLIV